MKEFKVGEFYYIDCNSWKIVVEIIAVSTHTYYRDVIEVHCKVLMSNFNDEIGEIEIFHDTSEWGKAAIKIESNEEK